MLILEIRDEFFLLKIYNKFKEINSVFWNRELIIIKLNPSLASPTIKHKNKNKNLNSKPVFKINTIIKPKVIKVISSKINNI